MLVRIVGLFIILVMDMHVSVGNFPDFTSLVESTSPAVVNIRATKAQISEGVQRSDEEVPEIFRRFFRQPERNQRPGVGSGFIIESDGYILTNNHVVEDANEIIVSLADRREREAIIVGTDPQSDLALLKIEEEDLPAVTVGRSEDLQAGQWVIAIGSPFDFEMSVTAGIVSAMGRSLRGEGANYVPFIQTDVAINPGNSGGPLIDLNGKVVGINSQIFTRSGGYMGLSFAIPIDVAMEVVEQIKEKGYVSRGWLGVLIQPVDRDLAESFGLDRPSGALVSQVFANSPAESAGLREGDIITSFNGKMIDLSSELPHLVGRARAESVAVLNLVRNKEVKTIEVTIGTLSTDGQENSQRTVLKLARGNRLGIIVSDLDAEGQRRLEVDRGVLVREVHSGPGAEAGIMQGDVITDFDGEQVQTSKQLDSLLGNMPGGLTVHVRLVRNGTPQYLAVKIPDGQ